MNFKLIDRILALGNLIGYARMAYIETDNQLCVSSWNSGARHLFGHTEDETMGKPLCDLIPVKKEDLFDCTGTGSLKIDVSAPDGDWIKCDLLYTPIISTKGVRLGTAVLAKNRSETGNGLPPGLDRQGGGLGKLFDFAPVGFFHVDMTGNLMFSNPEFAWMTGYESSEAVIEGVTDFSSQIFFDRERSEEFMFAIFEAGEVIRFRCRLRRNDNSFVWALCYAKTTHDRGGRVNGFDGFAMDISETVRAEQELKRANQKLKMLSVIDGLTGIPNRRKFDEYLGSEWNRHFREKNKISLILADIDFFKLYNDTYGHQAGDDCLIKVAGAINDSVGRSSDLAARYGGEEFAIILPDTGVSGLNRVAESIQHNVRNMSIPHEASKVNGHVTLSLGLATALPGADNSLQDLISQADKALYQAKENGRNQSFLSDPA